MTETLFTGTLSIKPTNLLPANLDKSLGVLGNTGFFYKNGSHVCYSMLNVYEFQEKKNTVEKIM